MFFGKTETVDLPSGAKAEVRRVSHAILVAAEDLVTTRATDTRTDFDPQRAEYFRNALSEATPEQQDDAHYAQYDVDFILRYGLCRYYVVSEGGDASGVTYKQAQMKFDEFVKECEAGGLEAPPKFAGWTSCMDGNDSEFAFKRIMDLSVMPPSAKKE